MCRCVQVEWAMVGAIIGDIAGSVYEYSENKDAAVELFPSDANFTDDSVLLIATAYALMHGAGYDQVYRRFGRLYPYPKGGYGVRFSDWLASDDGQAYNSWGNGSAMRVAPIGWAFDTLEDTLDAARASAIVTHNHPEGVKGAEATAGAIWLARMGNSKEAIRRHIAEKYGYDLNRSCDDVRSSYRFNESCQGTVPEAMIAFFDSTDFEEAIRFAISLGGDADTLACITGGIAQAYYGRIPDYMVAILEQKLDGYLLPVVKQFNQKYRVRL